MSDAYLNYDALKLPEHIETVLLTGAGGFVGREVTQLMLDLYPTLRIITTDIIEPPRLTDDPRLRVVKADLGDTAQIEALFEGEKVGGLIALHGIMSGGSEANFELGYAVNVDSHVSLLKAARRHSETVLSQPMTYVFISSLAVYGGDKCKPIDRVIPADTPIIPGTSYGVEKTIIELYAYDYGRRGYLDTRSCRLPTVAIRTGAPSTAASSFISGLIREPLQGIPSVCPIAESEADLMLDNMPVYLSRAKTVFRNIVWGLCMPPQNLKYGKGDRSINIPGIRVTPRQILAALKEHAGEEGIKLVEYKKDAAVIAICETWAGDYDSSAEVKQGFVVDNVESGFSAAVQDFKDELALVK
ncbi:hypothetical protein CspHIS471_0105370 [Cutaneotrichosporon sp. HIS471]|nr:hypothetical protein CspHIS471_0105370 [Cutaneotrichosporon sp. HIS471]